MNLNINVKYLQKDYTQNELDIITNIFGLFTKNVYFSLNINEQFSDDYKFLNFSGISGSGKTVIKNHIKSQLLDEKKYVVDFDDSDDDFFEKHKNKNILELFDVKTSKDDILKIVSYFGLFEMRILLCKIEFLSQGQITRLKYIHLFNQISSDKTTYILIDEFLTFVDEITAINFARGIKKYLKDKNIKLFTFGVQSGLMGQFEDISFLLGNSCINAVIQDGKISYKHEHSTTSLDDFF